MNFLFRYVIIFSSIACLSLSMCEAASGTITMYGDTAYNSNGDTYISYGDTGYDSNGNTYTRYGDTLYSSDGTSYTRYGDTVYSSDGVSYTTYGDTTYGSDGSTYTRYGDTIYYDVPDEDANNDYFYDSYDSDDEDDDDWGCKSRALEFYPPITLSLYSSIAL